MRAFRSLFVTAAALACLAGSAQAEEKILRLYNWADYFAEDTLSRFTAETGIQVVYDVMDGSETLEAKLMAGNSGYDLVFPGDTVADARRGPAEARREQAHRAGRHRARPQAPADALSLLAPRRGALHLGHHRHHLTPR